MPVTTLIWENDALRLIDQTKLPEERFHLDCRDVETVAEAIESLRVRGAPAIGVAAAYGVVVGADEALVAGVEFESGLRAAIERLARTRPTAVNLFWALNRMERVVADAAGQDPHAVRDRLLEEANTIFEEDRAVCRQIGRNGAQLLEDGSTVLTHCNAGGLATADYGTALAVIYAAEEEGKRISVYADETRPLLQGSRLTAWELQQSGVDVTVICDNMAATVLRQKDVDCVIVGSDRIAANGDVANKIGTYGVAILAREHGVPFYVAAPLSTIDMTLPEGDQIPIEERDPSEITHGFGRQTAPDGVKVYSPAFDVTPNRLVNAIITEKGVASAPYRTRFQAWFERDG
ncbi:MAG: S-methyl-5-thioribose-1-phosphate isomerase [Candidatus Latescibacteria bacterium]|jgi:methylthioribose-1-phosphate isomerase|nr:S-methyl-5-thioribose-1-phosphate isomerase [Candidatus Latescibacterota bacterium]